jgi:hypothetical protein
VSGRKGLRLRARVIGLGRSRGQHVLRGELGIARQKSRLRIASAEDVNGQSVKRMRMAGCM